jgi:hypothetical protein
MASGMVKLPTGSLTMAGTGADFQVDFIVSKSRSTAGCPAHQCPAGGDTDGDLEHSVGIGAQFPTAARSNLRRWFGEIFNSEVTRGVAAPHPSSA